jgi:hypothetical protein
MEMRNMQLLYNDSRCNHEALLLALVAYKSKDISDNEYYAIVDSLDWFTNTVWQLEVL